jgi:hypothetical protein
MQKICNKCQILKTEDHYYDNSRGSMTSYCKPCHVKRCSQRQAQRKKEDPEYRKKMSNYSKQWIRKNRERYNELSREFVKRPLERKKQYARQKLFLAIKNGEIFKRNSCEFCHNGPTEGHHEDYKKHLDVIWMCRQCHGKLHQQYKIDQSILIT